MLESLLMIKAVQFLSTEWFKASKLCFFEVELGHGYTLTAMTDNVNLAHQTSWIPSQNVVDIALTTFFWTNLEWK